MTPKYGNILGEKQTNKQRKAKLLDTIVDKQATKRQLLQSTVAIQILIYVSHHFSYTLNGSAWDKRRLCVLPHHLHDRELNMAIA